VVVIGVNAAPGGLDFDAFATLAEEIARAIAVDCDDVRGAFMNRDELEGKAEALKGRIKQATGDLTNNPDLHDEGVADEVAGQTQHAMGRIRRKVGKALKDVGNAIKK
jgi:uncharacterized protein YjbJ (UPF0337 family)